MAKSAMQKIKILYLMKILQEQTDDEHGLTVKELIDRLADLGVQAERKTIYDDIETLRTFGMDIEARKDTTVRYHLVSRLFELPELKLLVDAVQGSKFITQKKSLELIQKLESLAGRHQAQRLSRQVHVSNRIKTMNESIYYAVDYIHEAIGADSQIAFLYFEWNADKKKQYRHDGKVYRVSPWGLTWDDENYYMIAYDAEASSIKHYRVDKMQSISVLEERRGGEELFRNFDMGLYSKKTFGMYGGREETVTLLCHNRLAGVVIDRFGLETVFMKHDADHFEIHVKVALSPPFLTWVMNFGKDMRVIAPFHVRDSLLRLAQDVLEQYKND